MSAHRVFAVLFASVLIALAFLIPATAQNPAKKPASEPYAWKSVQMVGGGFVDGIIFHPTAKGVRYARTDMGGAYRWNDETKRWEPILDWVSYEDLNLMGVESIAVDPSDANRVYLACGTYTNARAPNGAILRSADRAQTFQRTNVPFKFGGNENGRGNGERMAVDPNDGNILYLGTRQAGLWKSTDRAVTWNKVASFPDVTEAPPPATPSAAPPTAQAQPGRGFGNRPSRGSGVVFTVFDPASSSKGKASSTIYVGVSLMGRDNLFRSTDGGNTWQAVPGQPTQYRPNHAVLASDGTLYLSYGTDPGPQRMTNGGVWKLDMSSFTAIEPLSIRGWAIPYRESSISIARGWTFLPIRGTLFVDDWDAPARAGEIHSAVRSEDPGICVQGGIGSGSGGGATTAREERAAAARDRAAPEGIGRSSPGSEAANRPVFPAQAEGGSTQ